MARQANIIVTDEHGFTWVVAEGDPGWAAASYAKKMLLLDKPILPRFLLRTGWPDTSYSTIQDNLVWDFSAFQAAPEVEIVGRIWEQTKREFRASKTQLAVYGGRVPSV